MKIREVVRKEYTCDVCGTGYPTEEEALNCEEKHKRLTKKEDRRKNKFMRENPPQFKRGDVVRSDSGREYVVMEHNVEPYIKNYANFYILQSYGLYDEKNCEYIKVVKIEENLELIATKGEFLDAIDVVENIMKTYGIKKMSRFEELVRTVKYADKRNGELMDE